MINTDMNFFTDKPKKDLYNSFAIIMKSNTQFLDALAHGRKLR